MIESNEISGNSGGSASSAALIIRVTKFEADTDLGITPAKLTGEAAEKSLAEAWEIAKEADL